MTDTLTPVLTAHWDQPDIFTIDGYRRAGGWQALPKALGMSRDEVITVVRNAGLRGRGGAGFATGVSAFGAGASAVFFGAALLAAPREISMLPSSVPLARSRR